MPTVGIAARSSGKCQRPYVGGPIVPPLTMQTAVVPMHIDLYCANTVYEEDEHRADPASGSPEPGCSLDELSLPTVTEPRVGSSYPCFASPSPNCPSGSPPSSRLTSPRRRRVVVSTRGQLGLNTSRVAIMSAIHSGQRTAITTALKQLTHVPQVAWPLVFQSAMLTTCPKRMCSLLDLLLKIVTSHTVSEADHYLEPMACSVADAPRSLAAYELYTRVSLTGWYSGAARPAEAEPRQLAALDERHFGWSRAVKLRTPASCPWNTEVALYELAEALVVYRDKTRATQAAFALVAAGRLHHAKMCANQSVDSTGTKFMSGINSLLRMTSETGVTTSDLKLNRARRHSGMRMEALVYLVVVAVCNRSTTMCDSDKAALRSACRLAIKVTDKNNLFSPYAMCAALISALLADPLNASCALVSDRTIPFCGQPPLMPCVLAKSRVYERHDPEDLTLGALCYAEGRGPSSSCWSMIHEAQFGRAENVRNFDARIQNILVPMWTQWFPSASNNHLSQLLAAAATNQCSIGSAVGTDDDDDDDDDSSAAYA